MSSCLSLSLFLCFSVDSVTLNFHVQQPDYGLQPENRVSGLNGPPVDVSWSNLILKYLFYNVLINSMNIKLLVTKAFIQSETYMLSIEEWAGATSLGFIVV